MALAAKLEESPKAIDVVVNASDAKQVPQNCLRRCHNRYAASHLLQMIDQSWHAHSECRAPDDDRIYGLFMHSIT